MEIEEFLEKYKGKDKLGIRYETFKMALERFLQNDGQLIVETGCTRLRDDWGAGMSTLIFADFCEKFNKMLISIDIEEDNIKLASDLVKDFKANIQLIVSDSLDALNRIEGQIDLLYLDSFDYPYGDLLDLYGGKTDIEKAKTKLAQMDEELIVLRHKSLINPSQEFQLKEFEIAEKHLSDKAVILLDDNDLPGGGKSRLTKKYLKEKGYLNLINSYQSLWVNYIPSKKI